MEFIYVTRLIERLKKDGSWTNEDEAIVSEHFNYLLELREQGKLVLAGKTDEPDNITFGIVIFKADDEIKADEIMNNDPAVKKGIMIPTLHKYSVAIFNNEYKK